MDIKKIWQWLRDPDNQGALKIVGGVIAAICVAVWTVFTFYKQNSNTSPIHLKIKKEMSIPSEPATTDTSSDTVNQTMNNSPGGVQVGRDLNINVNTDRRVSRTAADIMIQGLKSTPCPITIGVLGMGGEPDRLANDLYQIACQAGGEVHGINHGVGFEAFTGIQVRYSPTNTPQVALSAITNALKADKLDFIADADRGQPPGSIYIFVGYKP